MANGKRGDDLLFATSTGLARSRATSFAPGCGCLPIGVPGSSQRVRFHDLRGAHASWLLAGGADLKAVMDRLGHRQIQTTQQYLGRLPDADDRALKAFEAVPGPTAVVATRACSTARRDQSRSRSAGFRAVPHVSAHESMQKLPFKS